jgi:hypothetical protein
MVFHKMASDILYRAPFLGCEIFLKESSSLRLHSFYLEISEL